MSAAKSSSASIERPVPAHLLKLRPIGGRFNFAHDVIEEQAHQRGHAPALWWLEQSTGRQLKISFGKLAQQLRQAATFFHESGLRRGDRVLVVLPRVPQWWIAMLGLIRLGAVPIPGTPQLTARDIRYRIDAAHVRGIITDADGAAKVHDFEGLGILVNPPGAPGTGWLDFDYGVEHVQHLYDPPPTNADDPGIIYFTSGTTGHPKMVLHTQASYGLGHRLTGELWLDQHPDDVHWNLSDTGWAKAAWSSFFGPWHRGACIFAVDSRGKFDPAATLDILSEFPITTWCAPPTALRLIVRQPLASLHLPHLRHCVSAGEPLNPEVFHTWHDATGLTLYEGYGQTETVVLVGHFRMLGGDVQPGSMGRPTPGFTVAILDEELHELPEHEPGEIAVRVRPKRPLGLFQEYWQNPEENAARFRGDWYLTGDIAYRDDHGRFWFVGRSDDVIKSAGYRIGPFEVESALIEHPAVLEAAVVGKPDPIRGQIVTAYVVLRPGHHPSDKLAGQLQDHCKTVTAPYKHPREITFVPDLPKTISGKIRRVELRRRDT